MVWVVVGQEMDLPLETIEVWRIDTEVSPRGFIDALRHLLTSGDRLLFGCYEPTEPLERSFLNLGASRHKHVPGLYTCFNVNQTDHPRGCAFELTIEKDTFDSILDLSDSVLCQADVERFFDHAVAYRPSNPRLPIFSFHDALHGGYLYLSGLFDEAVVANFNKKLEGRYKKVANPVLQQRDPC